ncbi:MAG: HpaII family restriction endonuclease [Mariprofundaceae bacterium]
MTCIHELESNKCLLLASKSTNFRYKLNVQLSNEEITRINSIDSVAKIKKRIAEIYRLKGIFEFLRIEKATFSNNLILIDSQLPCIMAKMVLKFYSSNISCVSELVGLMERDNPLNFDGSEGHEFYRYKIKRFLTDVALGMMPSKVWTGELDVTGGYLVVKEDGDVLCDHIYNQNEFEDYLIHNSKLETASSSRHGFGFIFEEEGNLFMNLNLQIRFAK